jgi:putative hydrolase of the HAD superfamily
MEKLRVCRLEGMFGTVMVSEAFGARKPDPSIFKAALRALGARPEDTVFVGDSWNVDIAPARALGMRAVWLNRYGNPCPDPGLAVEIREFGDADLFL